jgi:hypothetical protein
MLNSLISKKWLAIILVFSVYCVEGIEVSISEGNGNGKIGTSTNYGATIKDSVSQEIVLNPREGVMANHLYFTGSGSTSRTVYASGGPVAKTGFSISGSPGLTKNYYEFYTHNGGTYAESWMDLTSYDAHSILGYGWAKSSNSATPSNYVSGQVFVYSPGYTADLVGYTVDAIGSTNSATLKQDYSSAYTSGSGGYISPYLFAKDYYDWSSVDEYLRSSSSNSAYSPYTSGAGINGGYKGYAYASRSTDITQTWQNTYGRAYNWQLISKAYQSYGSQNFYDNDNYYPYGVYNLMKQWSSTGTTSGSAYNTHYW